MVREGAVKGTKNLSNYSKKVGQPIRMKASQVGTKAADPVCDGVKPPMVLLPPNDLRVVMARP